MNELDWNSDELKYYELSSFHCFSEDVLDFEFLDLFTAASIGCTEKVCQYIVMQPLSLNKKNEEGWTALMYAAYYGHKDTVNVILKAGGSVHLQNDNGCNALTLATMCGKTSVVEMLVKAGSKLEIRDNKGLTALLYAICSSYQQTFEVLLEYGANPNSYDTVTWMTPLMMAAKQGSSTMIMSLLKAGALPSLATPLGCTAAYFAQQVGLPSDVVMALCKNQNNNTMPYDLKSLLESIGLSSYISCFDEQGVDLSIFLTLAEDELKQCGIIKLGPRRKMTSAIARWHSNAPVRSSIEGVYADKLEIEMQQLQKKYLNAVNEIKELKKQVEDETTRRKVLETSLSNAKAYLNNFHRKCQLLKTRLLKCQQLSILIPSQPSYLTSLCQLLSFILEQTESMMAYSYNGSVRLNKMCSDGDH